MKKKSNVVAHCATDNLKKGLKSSEYKEGRFWGLSIFVVECFNLREKLLPS